MDLEDITFSEISQSQKSNPRSSHLHEASRVVKIMETESRRVSIPVGGGEGLKEGDKESYCLWVQSLRFAK